MLTDTQISLFSCWIFFSKTFVPVWVVTGKFLNLDYHVEDWGRVTLKEKPNEKKAGFSSSNLQAGVGWGERRKRGTPSGPQHHGQGHALCRELGMFL